MNVTLLSRLRRARWLHVIQILVFVSWIMNPFPGAFSYWALSSGAKTDLENPAEGDPWYLEDADGDGFTNAQEAQFGSDPYRLDSDLDGLPDSVEYQYSLGAITAGTPLPYDPWNWDTNANGFSDFDEFYQQIQAYNLVVNYNALPAGATWSAGTYFSYSDADGDGIKNFEDSDPLNMNRDGDELLNWYEAAGQMDDPYNGEGPPNSDPPPPTDPGVIIGGSWYPTGTLDSDGDGTPDHLDSFPYGSFWYQGIEYGGASSDRDGDGIPDPADPFPDGSYWYNNREYAAPWVDQDGDGVPDVADAWPTIAGSYWYNGMENPGMMPDQDNDGIPDAYDTYFGSGDGSNGGGGGGSEGGNDGGSDGGGGNGGNGGSGGEPPPTNPDTWNGQPHYNYNGVEYAGTWSDSDLDGIPDGNDAMPNGSYWYNGTEYPGSWIDQDSDGIPDAFDSYPSDQWNGAPHFTYQGVEYPGSLSDDRDSDTIPDAADAYPDDRTNRADSDSDGLSDFDENTQYGTDPAKADTDDDRLNDSDELFTYHTNPLLAKTNPDQPFSDFYMVNQADGDADGIPNGIEQWYADQGLGMNPADPADARGDLDGDGYTNLQAYTNGWSLTAHSGTYDVDNDGILDVLEDAWNAAYPGILSNSNFNDAVEDFDGDGLMNYEEITLGLNPGSAHSRSPAVMDMQEWVWRICAGMSVTNQPLSGITWNTAAQPAWQVTTDGDNDRLPDGLLALATALNADPSLIIVPQRAASGDYDGDGMLDYWEHRYHLDPRAAADAQANPDGDSLINSLEYAQGRNPLVSDDPPPEPPVEITPSPQIITNSLPNGVVNSGYNVGITATGGTGPYVFSLSSGSLPDGLFLDENGGITGTPTTEMSSGFTVQMTDINGINASQAFTLNVLPDSAGGGPGGGGTSPPPPLIITTTDAQMHAVIGKPFSVTLEASGGISNHYIFTITNMGTLPTGLEMSEDHKTIHGTPTVTGSCSFTVTLTNASPDGLATPGSSNYEFTISVHDLPAFVTNAELPGTVLGQVYSVQLETSGGYGQKLFNVTAGALPPDMVLTPGGRLMGASSATGHYAFSVRVTDALGSIKDQDFTMNVAEPSRPMTITTVSLPTGGVGLAYSAGIGVSGGNGSYTFTGGGGIFSVTSTGSISGFPTEPGVYAVSVTVTDTAEGTASAAFVISVAAPTLSISSGDKQILKVGDTPAPVIVSLTAGGIGLAGVQVTMGSQITTTDEYGSATFLPQVLMTEGPHNFPVNFPGSGDTVAMFAYTPPAGMGGTTPEVLPGPPPEIPVRPVEDDDVIFESRSVSYTSGTLQAHYSGGMAVTYVNKQFQTYRDGSIHPDYSSSKTIWNTSDGQSGEGTPPSIESLPWRPGLADGYDRKYPDTESGPVDGPDNDTAGVSWPEDVPFTIVYNGGYNGKSVGRQKHTTSQIRLRRKTVEEGGSGSTEGVQKYFSDLTKENKPDGMDATITSCTSDIILGENLNESTPVALELQSASTNATTRTVNPIQIIPDTNMVGVVGDLLDSAKPTDPTKPRSALKHFVSPKKAGDYIIFTVTGLTADQMTDNFASTRPGKIAKWEGGEEVPGEPLKRRVSRDNIGKSDLKIKMLNDGIKEQTKVRVWITWCNGLAERPGHPIYTRQDDTTGGGIACKSANLGFPSQGSVKWKFAFTIKPAEIITDKEIPDLKGNGDVLVPTSENPTKEREIQHNNLLSSPPINKWDVSRRMKIRVINPSGIPAHAFSYGYSGIYAGQPKSDSEPVKFVTDLVVGNDDLPDDNDERTNPYIPEPDRPVPVGETVTYDEIGHQNIGVITSTDAPEIWLPELAATPPGTWGSEGSIFEEYDDFEEFARLQIGKRWYVVSDPVAWTHYAKFKKVNGKWVDNRTEATTTSQSE